MSFFTILKKKKLILTTLTISTIFPQVLSFLPSLTITKVHIHHHLELHIEVLNLEELSHNPISTNHQSNFNNSHIIINNSSIKLYYQVSTIQTTSNFCNPTKFLQSSKLLRSSFIFNYIYQANINWIKGVYFEVLWISDKFVGNFQY